MGNFVETGRGEGRLLRTDFDKIACDKLNQNYAFKNAFPEVFFKRQYRPKPFLAELKNLLKF